jgi:hypothetical protein
MEIPYKGYTITPSSERQPDGRWLPVAELETVHRGIVTTRPPLRAASREVRASRADADAAAVRMAKVWIDANERAPAPADPSPAPARNPARAGRAAPPPPADEVRPVPAPPEARAPGTRADAVPLSKGAGDEKPPVSPQKLDWAELCQAVGLDSDEKVDRLTRLLVVHSLLDRLVTLVLATKIASSSESEAAPGIETAVADVAPLPMPARIDLGSALGVVAPAVAESVAEVDRVRSRLAHPKSARGRPPWDVGDIEEIASQAACDRCVRKGIQAAHDLISSLQVRWPPPPQ